MAVAEPSTVVTVPLCDTGRGTISLVEETICARILDGVHFDFDYTFIRPEAKPIIREITDDINRDAERKVLIAGHTDRVGSNAYNETLSDGRATSVLGYITNQPDIWMGLLRTMLSLNGGPRENRSGTNQSRDRWQTREIQYMLNYMRSPTSGDRYYDGPINNVFNADLQTALDEFRADNGLPAGGVSGSPRWAGVDEDSWRKMFERYIALDAVSVDQGRFLDPAHLACGERFPRLETRPPGSESQDQRDAAARLEINRRVEFLLIPPSLVPDPLTCEAIYDNPNNPVVICPTDPQPITVRLVFLTRDNNIPQRPLRPMPDLQVKITGQGGSVQEATTNEDGQIDLANATQGDYRVEAVGNFGLVLQDNSYGEVRGAEVLLHLTQSAAVEIQVIPVATRLNFVANTAPFDETLSKLDNPLESAGPVEFRLAADLENVTGDTITVMLHSYLIREPASPVPGDDDDSGVVTPPTPLEFVDATDTTVQEANLNRRVRLRLDDANVVGDTVTVTLRSHWRRDEE